MGELYLKWTCRALLGTLFLAPTINAENRVHDAGNIRMNVTDRGYFGNWGLGAQRAMTDPARGGEWAHQAEFPAGSGTEYLFQGGLWIGGIICREGYEFPRVSVALDGWVWSGEGEFRAVNEGPIVERSNIPGAVDYRGADIYSPDAAASQEFLTEFADTCSNPDMWDEDPVDGPHVPLGLKVRQRSMVWRDADFSEVIIIQWNVDNISDNYLKNIYLGFYYDGDVGALEEDNRFTDDLCGYRPRRFFESDEGGLDSAEIDFAYLYDNDGRNSNIAGGADFASPGVMGVMLLDPVESVQRTSFNWWNSNGDPDLDYGPSWTDDNAMEDWTSEYGTPMGDERKYFLMRNREIDFDALYTSKPRWIADNPQRWWEFDIINHQWVVIEQHEWKQPEDELPPNLQYDLTNGFDAKFLISWGPLGEFDHVDEHGNRITRLDPGMSFTTTIAIVACSGFHDAEHPQPDNVEIDPTLFNFNALNANTKAAQNIFLNYLGAAENRNEVPPPANLFLLGAYPNPFNSSTFVTFMAPTPGIMRISLLDAIGQRARDWSEWTPAGEGRLMIDGAGLAAGAYWIRLERDGLTASRKAVLIK